MVSTYTASDTLAKLKSVETIGGTICEPVSPPVTRSRAPQLSRPLKNFGRTLVPAEVGDRVGDLAFLDQEDAVARERKRGN